MLSCTASKNPVVYESTGHVSCILRLLGAEPTDDFQEKLIVFVALLTCVSLVGATVMGVVQILRLKARTSGLEALLDGANGTTNVSDWSKIAGTVRLLIRDTSLQEGRFGA
ncbi:hypothetical protein V5799_017516 [Amblyomma americanum]|uniref:Uncharacterized protein n=1 Tax=Amblyomma americanum TaxID=6943 RepID=A0AAQ4F1Y2_AMBAM